MQVRQGCQFFAERNQHLSEHPAIDVRHHLVAFRRGDKGTGVENVAVAVTQAQQDFVMGGLRFPADRADFLGIEQKAIRLQRLAQTRGHLQLQVPARGFAVIRGVHRNPVTPPMFGGVAGHVCPTHGLFHADQIAIQLHQTDAGTDIVEGILPGKTDVSQGRDQSFGNLHGLVRRAAT